jgi:hypothetical protein
MDWQRYEKNLEKQMLKKETQTMSDQAKSTTADKGCLNSLIDSRAPGDDCDTGQEVLKEGRK